LCSSRLRVFAHSRSKDRGIGLCGEELFEGGEEWVDGEGLDFVRGMPGEPLIPGMLGGADFHVAKEAGEEDHERFVTEYAVALAADLILCGEAEVIDDFDIFVGDARFFVEFPKGALHF